MRFWIGGTGVTSDTNHWSDQSGGSGGFSVPTATDPVYFDNLSGSANYTVSIDTNMLALDFDVRNPSTGTVTIKQSVAGSKMWTIYGNIYTAAGVNISGITGSQTNGLIVRGATTGRTITTNGVLFPSISVYEGAGYVQQDDFTHIAGLSTLLMFNGAWNSNGFDMTLRSFQTSSGPLNLDFTNSTISCSSEWINQAGNITLVSTGSTISCRGRWFSGNAAGGGKCTYDTVVIDPSSSVTASPSIDGGNFYNLKMYGYHAGTFNTGTTVSADLYIANNLELYGAAQDNRFYLQSSTSATPRTITCDGTVTVNYVDMSDMIGAGLANWDLSANNYFGDALGNSGIVFSPSQTIYIKSLSTNTIWHQTNIWFSDSNCTTPTRIPLPQDDVLTVPTSFVSTAGRSLTLGRNRVCRDLDLSIATYPPSLGRSTECGFYGSFKGCPTVQTGSQIWYFYGRGNHTIDPNGMTMSWTDNILAPGGIYTLLGEYRSNGGFFGTRQGTFISSGYKMDCLYYALSLRVGGTGITLLSDMTGSTLIIRGSGTSLWTAPTGGQASLDFTNATIEFMNTSAGTFACGANLAYNNLRFSNSSTVAMTATTKVVFNNIHFSPTANSIWTLMNVVPVWYNTMTGGGAPRALMTIQNTSGTLTARFDKQIAGIDVLNYMVLRYTQWLDANTLYAVNSYNIIGNVNIIFGQAPGAYRTSDWFNLL